MVDDKDTKAAKAAETKDTKAARWSPGARTITLAHDYTVVVDGERKTLAAGTEYKCTKVELEENPHLDSEHPDVLRARVSKHAAAEGIDPAKLRAVLSRAGVSDSALVSLLSG